MTSSDLRALCVILPSRRSPSRGDDGASPSRLALESKHRQISFDNGRMATALEPEVRKFTIAEYYKLAEAGVLAPSERVELLDGRIIRMAPIGPRHATIVDKLTGRFVLAEKGRYRTGPGRPVRITNLNEPQPDLVLYKRKIEDRHPGPEDIFLVVEVADTTLDYDSGEKLRAYEKGGIKEYWIIDAAGKAAHLYHLPARAHKYVRETRTHGVIAPRAFPDAAIDLSELF